MARKTSAVLRDIDLAQRQLSAYKTLRRILLGIITVAAPVVTAGAIGVVDSGAVSASVVALIVSVGVLTYLTFYPSVVARPATDFPDPYRTTTYAPPIPALTYRLDLLREQLAEADTK